MQWRAEVTVAGVSVPTEEQFEEMLRVVPGVVARHEESDSTLTLVWRREYRSGSDAVSMSHALWWWAIDVMGEEATDAAELRSFRVDPVTETEE